MSIYDEAIQRVAKWQANDLRKLARDIEATKTPNVGIQRASPASGEAPLE